MEDRARGAVSHGRPAWVQFPVADRPTHERALDSWGRYESAFPPRAHRSGKTALALARPAHAIEVVSVDSAQVYRGMDVGTASRRKRNAQAFPTTIDIVEPTRAYWRPIRDDALRLPAKSTLVGGSGLRQWHDAYFNALTRGRRLPIAQPRLARRDRGEAPARLARDA